MYAKEDVFIGYDKYTLNEFEFESGAVLEDVVVEFSSKGTPKFDDDGNISNAVIYCHPFNGNYSAANNLGKLLEEGAPLDLNEYFFISITSLGFPESCSPSTTDLRNDFPKYTIKDRVNFKRQFIREKFGLTHILGVIGKGVGGYEAYSWACEYPDEMKFLIVVGSSYKTNGYRYVVSKCMESIIESSDDFYSDMYSASLSKIMVSVNRLLYSNYFSKRIFQNMSNDEIDILMDDFVDDGMFVDIFDFKYRNDAILDYNVEDKLENITAESFIISSNDDIYYTPEFDTIPLENLIGNVTVKVFKSTRSHINYNDPSILENDLKEFLDSFNKKRNG